LIPNFAITFDLIEIEASNLDENVRLDKLYNFNVQLKIENLLKKHLKWKINFQLQNYQLFFKIVLTVDFFKSAICLPFPHLLFFLDPGLADILAPISNFGQSVN
jgi:hypothetical protein